MSNDLITQSITSIDLSQGSINNYTWPIDLRDNSIYKTGISENYIYTYFPINILGDLSLNDPKYTFIFNDYTSFNGNNYTITYTSNEPYDGLISVPKNVGNTEIKNLKFTTLDANSYVLTSNGGYIVQNNSYIGSLNNTLENVHVLQGNILSVNKGGGGIIGSNSIIGISFETTDERTDEKTINVLPSMLTMNNCSFLGIIGNDPNEQGDIAYYCGGIVGPNSVYNNSSLYVNKCFTTGIIYEQGGGIIGAKSGYNSSNITIEECYSTGDISGIITEQTSTYANSAGGIIGSSCGWSPYPFNNKSSKIDIINSYSNGKVPTNAGGIIGGYQYQENIPENALDPTYYNGVITISNCYMSGTYNKRSNDSNTGFYGLGKNTNINIIQSYASNGATNWSDKIASYILTQENIYQSTSNNTPWPLQWVDPNVNDAPEITINAESSSDYKIIALPSSSNIKINANTPTALTDPGYYVIQVQAGKTINVSFNKDFNTEQINQLGYLLCAGGQNGGTPSNNSPTTLNYSSGGGGGASLQNEYEDFYQQNKSLEFTCGDSNEESYVKYDNKVLSRVGFNNDISVNPLDYSVFTTSYNGGAGGKAMQVAGNGNPGINSDWIGVNNDTLKEQKNNTYNVYSFQTKHLLYNTNGQGGGGASGWPYYDPQQGRSSFAEIYGGKGGNSGSPGNGTNKPTYTGENGVNGGGGGGGGAMNYDMNYVNLYSGGMGGQGLLNFYFHVGQMPNTIINEVNIDQAYINNTTNSWPLDARNGMYVTSNLIINITESITLNDDEYTFILNEGTIFNGNNYTITYDSTNSYKGLISVPSTNENPINNTRIQDVVFESNYNVLTEYNGWIVQKGSYNYSSNNAIVNVHVKKGDVLTNGGGIVGANCLQGLPPIVNVNGTQYYNTTTFPEYSFDFTKPTNENVYVDQIKKENKLYNYTYPKNGATLTYENNGTLIDINGKSLLVGNSSYSIELYMSVSNSGTDNIYSSNESFYHSYFLTMIDIDAEKNNLVDQGNNIILLSPYSNVTEFTCSNSVYEQTFGPLSYLWYLGTQGIAYTDQYCGDPPFQTFTNITNTLPASGLVHLVMVVNGTQNSLYRNGTLLYTSNNTLGTFERIARAIQLGPIDYYPFDEATTTFKKMRFYNKALTSGEISTLNNNRDVTTTYQVPKPASLNIKSCSFLGSIGNPNEIAGDYIVGGIIGSACVTSGSTLNISLCFTTGTIYGSGSGGITGGQCGYNSSFINIDQCYSTGKISGSQTRTSINDKEGDKGYSYSCGGIMGTQCGWSDTPINNEPSKIKVTNCYSQGSIVDTAGGILGGYQLSYDDNISSANFRLINCYMSGSYVGTDAPYAGNGSKYKSTNPVQLNYFYASNGATNWSDVDASNALTKVGTIYYNTNENIPFPFLWQLEDEFIFNSTTLVGENGQSIYTYDAYKKNNNDPTAPSFGYITDQSGSTSESNPSTGGSKISTQKWPQNYGSDGYKNYPVKGYSPDIGGYTCTPAVDPPGYQSFGGKANIDASNPTLAKVDPDDWPPTIQGKAYNSDEYATYTGYNTKFVTLIMTGGGGGAGGPGSGTNGYRGGTGGGGGAAAQYYGTISIKDEYKSAGVYFQKFEIQVGGGGAGGVGGAKNTNNGRKGLIGFDGGITACRITLNNDKTITISCPNGRRGDYGASYGGPDEGKGGAGGAISPLPDISNNAEEYVTLNTILSYQGDGGNKGENNSEGGGQGGKLNSDWIDYWTKYNYTTSALPNFDLSSSPIGSYYYFKNDKGDNDSNAFYGPYYYGMGGPSASATQGTAAANSLAGRGGYLYIYSGGKIDTTPLTELINIPINMTLQKQNEYINNNPPNIIDETIASKLNSTPIN